MSGKLIWFVGSFVTILVGLLIMSDGQRLLRHVRVAQALIAQGVPEPEAMERSGANHWSQPFILRIWKKYPPLPEGW